MAMSKEMITTGTKKFSELLAKEDVRKGLSQVLPKTVNLDRLLRMVVTAVRANPMLLECTQSSLLASVMGCAILGLEPEPFLGQAYIVPYRRKGTLIATLIPGYRGYLTLARRSGEVQAITAQAVKQNDHFQFEYGLNERLEHRPATTDRGETIGAYVLFRYKDGGHSFEYLPKSEIDKRRDRSKASEKEAGPWITDYDEMAVKTVIRHHIKMVPLSIEELRRAAVLEERFLAGEDQISALLDGAAEDVQATVLKSDEEKIAEFDRQADIMVAQKELFNHFLTLSAQSDKSTVEKIKTDAVDNNQVEALCTAFLDWQSKQNPTENAKRSPGRHPKEKQGNGAVENTTQPGAKERPSRLCPDTNGEERRYDDYCNSGCSKRTGCPAWNAEERQPGEEG